MATSNFLWRLAPDHRYKTTSTRGATAVQSCPQHLRRLHQKTSSLQLKVLVSALVGFWCHRASLPAAVRHCNQLCRPHRPPVRRSHTGLRHVFSPKLLFSPKCLFLSVRLYVSPPLQRRSLLRNVRIQKVLSGITFSSDPFGRVM